MAASLKAIILFVAVAAGVATDVLPALSADDECAAGFEEAGCALNALQLNVQRGGPSGLLGKINTALQAKVADLNSKLQGILKAKDPMHMNMTKEKMSIQQLSGMGSLMIDSFKATALKMPHVTFAMTAHWGSALGLSGQMSGRKGPAPFDIQMGGVSFETQQIVAVLDADTGAIESFNVTQVKVKLGAPPVVHVQAGRRFQSMIMGDAIKKKLMEAQAKVTGKIAGKVTQVLSKVFNEKLKDAINKKLEKKAGATGEDAGHNKSESNQVKANVASGGSDIVAKVNGVLQSKLGEINDKLGTVLKAKDPMTLDMHHGKVEFNKLSGISALHLAEFKVNGLKPPTVSLGLSANWGAPLKLVGAGSGMSGPVPISISMQQVSFHTDGITAQLDPNTGAIDKFNVTGVKLQIGKTQVDIQIRMRFIRQILDKKVNEMLEKKKDDIAGKIESKVEKALDKVLNGEMKKAINEKMQKMGS